jgi:hypothetical protein
MAGRWTETWDGNGDGNKPLPKAKYSAKIKVINQSKLAMQFPFGRWGKGTGETDGVTGIAVNPVRRLIYCAVGGSSQVNSRIVVYDYQGSLVKTFRGSGTGTGPGQLNSPLAICIDKNNDIYILDPAYDGRIQKFNQDYIYTNQTTNLSNGSDWPYGGAMTVDPQGKIYVGYRNNIRVYNSNLIEQFNFSSKKPGESDDKLISGIAVDGSDMIWVMIQPSTLRKFSPSGSFLADYSVSNSQYGTEIAISAGRLIYIKSSSFLAVWDTSGKELLRQSAPSYLAYSTGIACDDFGNIFCTGGAGGFNLGETELAKFTDVYTLDSYTTALIGGSVTDVNRELTKIPATYSLAQNYPNPFNPITRIRFELPNESFVSLTVYNILGQRVAVLVNDERPAGIYEVQFNGSKLASGVYFYRLNANNYIATKKLLLLK